DVLLSGAKKAVQPGAWVETVIHVHGFFQRLFRRPISAACLRTVISTYHATDDEPEYHFGPNPTDALQFVQAIQPGCTWGSSSAAVFLENLVRYSHYYQFYCPDFVHRFFHHNMILGVVEFWISYCLGLPSRVPTFASTPDEYRAQVANILRIARSQAAEGYMPLTRMLFDSDNHLALVHLGAHSLKLLRMFPLYLEQSRIVKIQMYLAFIYHSRPELDLQFYILMTTFGGIYRGAAGYGEVEDKHILLAPLRNYSYSLLHVTDPAPPLILTRPPAMQISDVEGYVAYIQETLRDDPEPTDFDGLYTCYEFRDHIQLPTDGVVGIPLEPFSSGPLPRAEIEGARWSRHSDPHEVTLPEVEQIRAWYLEEQVAYYHNCVESSSVDGFQRTAELHEILFRESPSTAQASPTLESGSPTVEDSHLSSQSRQPRPHQGQVASVTLPATLPRFEVRSQVLSSQPPAHGRISSSSPTSDGNTGLAIASLGQDDGGMEPTAEDYRTESNMTSPLRPRWSQGELDRADPTVAATAAAAPRRENWPLAHLQTGASVRFDRPADRFDCRRESAWATSSCDPSGPRRSARLWSRSDTGRGGKNHPSALFALQDRAARAAAAFLVAVNLARQAPRACLVLPDWMAVPSVEGLLSMVTAEIEVGSGVAQQLLDHTPMAAEPA
ncbi:hypothetical protein B484DRAFT_472007, partial [Ochromonadaceae sp. CCMP2298]